MDPLPVCYPKIHQEVASYGCGLLVAVSQVEYGFYMFKFDGENKISCINIVKCACGGQAIITLKSQFELCRF